MTRFYRAYCPCGDSYETPSEQAAAAHADDHEAQTEHRTDIVSYEDKV